MPIRNEKRCITILCFYPVTGDTRADAEPMARAVNRPKVPADTACYHSPYGLIPMWRHNPSLK